MKGRWKDWISYSRELLNLLKVFDDLKTKVYMGPMENDSAVNYHAGALAGIIAILRSLHEDSLATAADRNEPLAYRTSFKKRRRGVERSTR